MCTKRIRVMHSMYFQQYMVFAVQKTNLAHDFILFCLLVAMKMQLYGLFVFHGFCSFLFNRLSNELF